MKTLYLDIFSGISGDMFVGAMIDLGVDAHALEHQLEKLKLDGWHLSVARGQKANISGVKFDVKLAHEPIHEHTHAEGPTHSHAHSHPHYDHEHDQGHAPGTHARGHTRDRGSSPGTHGGPLVNTSQGQVELSVFETNVPPRFRLYFRDGNGNAIAPPAANTVTLETIRPEKKMQSFKFKRLGGCL